MSNQHENTERMVIWDGRSRPTIDDFTKAEFDLPRTGAPARKLLICSPERTLSWALVRYLLAAGIGVGHEYFHPQFAGTLAKRWEICNGVTELEASPELVQAYCTELQARRQVNGCFLAKIQHWQFRTFLCNDAGRALFEDARLIYLIRSDIGFQAASLATANITGVWGHEREVDGADWGLTPGEEVLAYNGALEALLVAETDWRRFFADTGQSPMILTSDDIGASPEDVVSRIAGYLDVDYDADLLRRMIGLDHRYEGWRREKVAMYARARMFNWKKAFGEDDTN